MTAASELFPSELELDGEPCRWWDQGYAVSSTGRVWSFWRSLGPCHGNRRVVSDRPRELHPHLKPNGYLAVRQQYVHRVVWQVWTGIDPAGLEVRHWDGNPANNQRENLRLGTPADNQVDMERHGTRPRLESHVNSKMTATQVREMRRLRANGMTVDQVIEAVKPPVSRSCAYDAMSGRTWKTLD